MNSGELLQEEIRRFALVAWRPWRGMAGAAWRPWRGEATELRAWCGGRGEARRGALPEGKGRGAEKGWRTSLLRATTTARLWATATAGLWDDGDSGPSL
jgi:hypothetical protein